MQKFPLRMIISGGQTGVDRAALDFALHIGICCSGWCPQGRRAEDGVIAQQYPLIEASSPIYQHRTRLNVKDSDATLIFTGSNPSKGTALTIRCCQIIKKPFIVVNLTSPIASTIQITSTNSTSLESTDSANMPEKWSIEISAAILKWLRRFKPAILNIAGPRASEYPAAAKKVLIILAEIICPAEKPPPIWPPKRPFTAKFRIF